MWILSVFVVIVIVFTFIVLNLPQFGKNARGERLRRIEASPNFREGEFRNLSETIQFTSDESFVSTFYKMLAGKVEGLRPEADVPTVKTILKELDPQRDYLIWMGHSSYFLQISGKKLLVDPVFSDYASPFPTIIKAFKGSTVYTADDLPEIDYLIITHDHWDHLDMRTIRDIHPGVKQVLTGLGVGAHLEHWGVESLKIYEFDWNDSLKIEDEFEFHATPARHFSGRGLKRNGTLWVSFVVKAPSATVFIGGDGGYDSHFTEIGHRFGPFDLALLENGQYDNRWKYIHMMPEEVIQAAIDLTASKLIPVHNSRFALAAHSWDEPLNRVSEQYEKTQPAFQLLTPVIGKSIEIHTSESTSKWWKNQ